MVGTTQERDTAERRIRRKPRGRLKFTRRFYLVVACFGGLLFLLVLILAVSASGGDGELQETIDEAGLQTADFHRLKVNELGAIMVLEYHKIGEEGRWSRTPENFRRDLETLYEQGYRCIRLSDLAANYIDVDPGYTPVVFTFDDSDISQFRYIEGDGGLVIDTECAMGIMEKFAEEHPDFGMTATFYVLPDLFGQPDHIERKLQYLVDRGYDIGNHTVNHPSLGEVEDATVVEEIAGNVEIVQDYLPDYRQLSIALPHGSEPQNPELLESGSTEDAEYQFIASLLVGANPAPAPCDPSFDAMRLPRVQALDPSLDSEGCGHCSWLQYFIDNPERRYRSDGNPEIVTIPQHMVDRVAMDRLGKKELRTY